MGEQKGILPEYSSPPVIETVLGVQFSPLSSFQVPHFGLFWNRVRQAYPHVEVQPPLSPVFGPSVPKDTRGQVQIRFEAGPPDFRCWFKNQEQTHLMQIQRDRFVVNWRKVTGQEVYPRYAQFRPRFQNEWTEFCKFLEEENLETPQVNQCEVTYVNHFESEKEFKSFGEAHKIFEVWSALPAEGFLPSPESVRFNMRFLLPDQKGRMHVVVEPKLRTRDGKEVLQVTLTCLGRPNAPTIENIFNWFDLGHEWIVQGFTQLTTHEMHQIWERRL
ncbi:MAG: TIGR04255 family protein [Nitrospira sp.]|nr:TIGR04255 family protein [Nitrospira sp.]MDE0485860.1 TIGR04255 family protein [Nitrospira sp.]